MYVGVKSRVKQVEHEHQTEGLRNSYNIPAELQNSRMYTFEKLLYATATSVCNETDDPPIRAQDDQLPFTFCVQQSWDALVTDLAKSVTLLW